MSEALRLSSLALFAVGPVVAALALRCRRLRPSASLHRIEGWRWYVPMALLPVEWLLPPALIAWRVGAIEAGWVPVRIAGLAVGLAGAVLLAWASVLLGRFLMHEAAVREDHALVVSGPYRLVRHPVYTGYLALLLGSGLASLNVCLLLLWPVSLLGILIQAASEEQLLAARFGREYQSYAGRVGRLVPRFRSRAAEPVAIDVRDRHCGSSWNTGCWGDPGI
jgi:protein-S-isoprenylcysteine O-methyltransferase Ste14